MIACKNAGIVQRRAPMQLFQFKHYNQQEPLELSESELDMVIDAVISPPEGSYEPRLIASKILIKVLVDRFIKDGEEAVQFLTTIASDMINDEEVETQLHAFNLLLNLSVHFNLLEESHVIGFDDRTVASSTPSLNKIQSAQQLLYDALLDMLSMLLESEEVSTGEADLTRLWTAALNCVLFWTTKDGKLLREPLSQLNIRFIPAFIRNTKPSGDFTQRHLLRMASNLIYERQSGLLVDQLEKVGGIHWVLHQYLSARSAEAQDNLFAVIYDYVVSTLDSKKKTSHPISDAYLEVLKRLNSSQLMQKIFKVAPPSRFVDAFINWIGTEDEWKTFPVPTTDNGESVDRKGFRKLLKGFRSLSQKFLAVSVEVNLSVSLSHSLLASK